MAIYQNITQTIGNTPLVRLHRLEAHYGCRCALYAKCEYLNPSGSIKDRTVMGILQAAARRGEITQETTVLCLSGGNGGISAAMACAVIGLPCIVIASDNIPLTTMRHIRAYGAKVLLAPAREGLEGMQQRAAQLATRTGNAFILDQFSDESGPDVHRAITGCELLDDLPEIDALVAGIGTGSTLTGCAEYIRRMRPDCLVVGVEPQESPVLSGGSPGNHGMTGIGPGFVAPVLNPYILDRIIRVRTTDAYAVCSRLAALEGMLCGPSSGAALMAALTLAGEKGFEGRNIAVILPDRGEEYLDREIYNP